MLQVDRYTKTKKSTYTGFELFRIKERDIPIEVLELENKNDKIVAFAWEPKGHRFAIIHGDGPRPDISFYSMRSPNNVGRVTKLTTLKGKQANALYWSPIGRFIILAGEYKLLVLYKLLFLNLSHEAAQDTRQGIFFLVHGSSQYLMMWCSIVGI